MGRLIDALKQIDQANGMSQPPAQGPVHRVDGPAPVHKPVSFERVFSPQSQKFSASVQGTPAFAAFPSAVHSEPHLAGVTEPPLHEPPEVISHVAFVSAGNSSTPARARSTILKFHEWPPQTETPPNDEQDQDASDRPPSPEAEKQSDLETAADQTVETDSKPPGVDAAHDEEARVPKPHFLASGKRRPRDDDRDRRAGRRAESGSRQSLRIYPAGRADNVDKASITTDAKPRDDAAPDRSTSRADDEPTAVPKDAPPSPSGTRVRKKKDPADQTDDKPDDAVAVAIHRPSGLAGPHIAPEQFASAAKQADRKSSLPEAYRSVCKTVLESLPSGKTPALLFASVDLFLDAAVTQQLAMAMAQELTDPVLAIDATPNAALTKQFGVTPSDALVDAVRGTTKWQNAIVQTPIPGLCLLPTSPQHERIDQLAFERLLADVRGNFGAVLIDVGTFDRTAELPLAAVCTATYLTLRLGFSPKDRVLAAQRKLKSWGASPRGCLLTTAAT